VSASRAFAASSREVLRLLRTGGLRFPGRHVGLLLRFADDTAGRVYRETVRDGQPGGQPGDQPALLVVQFELRALGRNRLLHRLFRAESLANTLLFGGFPGFRSKLWLAGDGTTTYRGLYDWDGAEQAEAYATTLCALLRPLCTPGSVRYHVEPDRHRDDLVYHPAALGPVAPADRWWRVRGGAP
jgi:hypothetical protein